MCNMNVKGAPTTYEKIVKSAPVQFAKENPVMTGAGVVGSAIIGKAIIDKSELAAQVLKKGAIPALAAGVAVAGVAVVIDGVKDIGKTVADDKSTEKDEHLIHIAETTGKLVGGTAMITGGTEVIGRAYGIEALQPLTQAGRFMSFYSNEVYFAGLSAGGAAIAVAGAKNMMEKGVGIGNSTAVTAGATIATSMASQVAFGAGASEIGAAVKTLDKATGVLGGAGLGLMSYAMAKSSINSMKEGHTGIGVITAVGAASAAVGSIHVLGNATGIELLSDLAPKLFGKNPLLAGAIVATTLTIGSYIAYTHNKPEESATPKK
jgi:hypothetical protein